jgi:hypothetical protein
VRLVNQFGGAEAALDALPALSRRGGRASIRVFTEAEAEAELPPSRPERLAALERGTITVLAGGFDVVYPPENADLQSAIGEQGLLLSERSPGFAPRAKDFPRRNRLISGISLGVVVVEVGLADHRPLCRRAGP